MALSEADKDEIFKLLEDGLDVFAAYVAQKLGLDELRDFLTGAINKHGMYRFREPLEDAAAKLDEHDLAHVAEVLLNVCAEMPSQIEENPWVEPTLAKYPYWPHDRQGKIWCTRFIMRRQAETGRHIQELAHWYRQFSPHVGNFSQWAGEKGYAWSRMREREPVMPKFDRD
jgi:hypothetical protein